MRIVLWRTLQKPFEHAVMIAFDNRPIAPLCLGIDHTLDHTTTVWTAIDQITHKNNGGILAPIALYPVQRLIQFI